MVGKIGKFLGVVGVAAALHGGDVNAVEPLQRLDGDFTGFSISSLAAICNNNTREKGAGFYLYGDAITIFKKNDGNTATPSGIASNGKIVLGEASNSNLGTRSVIVDGCDASTTGGPVYIATASQKAAQDYVVNSAMFAELPNKGSNDNGTVFFTYTGQAPKQDLVDASLGYLGGLTTEQVQEHIQAFTKANPQLK